MTNKLQIFDNKKVRTHWDVEKEEWYFSIIDVIAILNVTTIEPRKYWSDLKDKLKKEGSELSEKIRQLKMVAEDGKMRETDVLETKDILRLVQSIPSPKAEPFKMWLAQTGNERLNEMVDPEQGFHRLYSSYKKQGYTDEWINNRLQSIDTREAYESELRRAGITDSFEYAILTNEMLKTWSGMTSREYKDFKHLKKENLKDNMSRLELVLNMLAEETATHLSKAENPKGFEQSKNIAKRGGNAAYAARRQIESDSGRPVITPLNFKQVKQLKKPSEE